MKALRLPLLLLALTTAACVDDEEVLLGCTQADWTGTYSGMINCTSAAPEDVFVTISASGSDAIIIAYETATITGEYSPITFDGCDLSVTDNTGGLNLAISATREGDQLRWMESVGDGSFAEDCLITATRN